MDFKRHNLSTSRVLSRMLSTCLQRLCLQRLYMRLQRLYICVCLYRLYIHTHDYRVPCFEELLLPRFHRVCGLQKLSFYRGLMYQCLLRLYICVFIEALYWSIEALYGFKEALCCHCGSVFIEALYWFIEAQMGLYRLYIGS